MVSRRYDTQKSKNYKSGNLQILIAENFDPSPKHAIPQETTHISQKIKKDEEIKDAQEKSGLIFGVSGPSTHEVDLSAFQNNAQSSLSTPDSKIRKPSAS